MTELQERVLTLLLEIDEICQCNGIEYYLAAGSALGAIRNRGFLPWDDDADIYMTANNWKKFLAVKNQLPEGRTIVTVDEGDYSSEYTINRYVDLTSTRLYRYLVSSPQPSGITVDIIILDPVPDDEESIRQHIVDLTEYANYLVVAAAHGMRCPYPTNDREIWERGKIIGRKEMLDELHRRNERFSDTKGGVLVQRDPTVPHVWKECYFGRPKYVTFENVQLPVASRTYMQLTGAFNEDWMYVPEAVERQEHVKGLIFDISGNNPFDDFMSRVDMEKLHNSVTELTYKTNLAAPAKKKQRWGLLKMAAAKIKLLYKKKGFDAETVREWTLNRDHSSLWDYYYDYAEMQCSSELIGNVSVSGWLMSQIPFYIDINDSFLYWFLRDLMHKPMLGKARVILNARKAAGPITPLVKELDNLIESAHMLSDLMDQRKIEEVMKEVEPLYVQYPENLRLMQLYYACRFQQINDADDRACLLADIENLPECDRDEEVIQCIKAELLLQENRYNDALAIFNELSLTATHGLVLDHIRNRFSKSRLESNESRISLQAEQRLGASVEILEDMKEEPSEGYIND